MIRRAAFAFLLAALFSTETRAQASTDYVFPLFADGAAGGLLYRSSVKILNASTTNAATQCTVTQRRTAATFTGLYGDQYFPEITDAGDSPPAVTSVVLDRFLPWEVLRSTGPSSSLKVGYISLSCSGPISPELRISLTDLQGTKAGETTLLPATQGNSFEFLVDRRDGTRLGFSLTNNSSVEGEYTIIARDEFNEEVDRASDILTAWSQVSRFVDEVLVLPANFVGSIEVVGISGGRNYVAGLQFTGSVFATVSPLVRSAPLHF